MDFYEDVLKLFEKLYKKGKPIRLVGVKFADLRDDDGSIQEDMFVKEDKYKSLVDKIDKIRKKYNYNAVKFGKTFDI